MFYAWPFATLLARGLGPGTAAETLGATWTWRVVWFTLWQAVASTILTLIVGLVPAVVMARYHFPGRRLLDGLLASVFVLPTVVVGAAVLALLPDSVDHGVLAILAAHVLFNLAVVVRTVGAVLTTVPRDLEHAAATLGASPRRVFREITLPAITPALWASAAIVFVFTFTSFGVVRLLGGVGRSTIEVEIWRQATQFGDIGAAATLTALQLAVVAAAVAVSSSVQRRSSRSLALRVASTRQRPATTRQRWFVWSTVATTATVALTPLAALVERSIRLGDGYGLGAWRRLGDEAEVRPGLSTGIDPLASLAASLQAMMLATALALVIGTLASVAIASAGRFALTLDTAMMLPIATSAITVGFGMLITFDVEPVDWRSSWWLVPVGHALVATPFVVRTVLPALRGVDATRLEAAATLGASPLRAWREIVVPHLRRPVVVAAGLSAAISLGEFGATSFLSRSGQETMPIAIERLLGRTGAILHAQGYVLAVILAAATIVVVTALDLAHSTGSRPGSRAGS